MKNKERVFSNFIWRFLERSLAQLVTFVVSVVLARLLTPNDYGLVALVTVFTSILQVFVDSGLGTALIQKKNADDLDFSSVFYFNIAACIAIYIVAFFSAPYIARFYGNDQITALFRVSSLTILISGIKGVQQAYVSRHMIFKRFFFATLGGTIVSAFVGILMAYNGFGAWAIVFQQLTNASIDTLILWLTVGWKPKKIFSRERLSGLLSFGWKMLASSLLDTVYNNLRNLLIGKIYSAADLAYYNQGDKFPKLAVNNINSSIDSVLLPAMSNEQNDRNKIKTMTRKSIQVCTYILAPMMIGMACCAENMITLVLTDKWLMCVPYLQIFCITYMMYPIHNANLNAINAMGRSDLFLKLEIVKKIIGLVLLLITVKISVMAMAVSLIVSGFLSQIVNSWPNWKLLDYNYLEQVRDIFPSILLASIMGLIVLLVGRLSFSTGITLCIQIIVGVVVYIGLSAIFKFEEYEYVFGMIKSLRKR